MSTELGNDNPICIGDNLNVRVEKMEERNQQNTF